MKKLTLNLLMVFTLISTMSCKNESKSSDRTETNTEQTTKSEKKQTEVSSDGAPSFSDKGVQEYVNLYEAYFEDYKKAANNKDMNAFAALGQKGQELATKSQEVMTNLSAEDAKSLTDYMTKKAKEIQALTEKMMQ